MKMEFDRLGEMALNRLNILCPPQPSLRQTVESSKSSAADGARQSSSPQPPKRDLYILLRDHASEDEILGQLWAESNAIPSWVCWEQIARGQDVFYRYGAPALTGLAFQSLLGGMGATRVVETLTRTELGVPINNLDCVATIGTFSATLIWLSFPRQGIWLRRKETEDYIALFRYIAYLMGTPDEFFETPERAKMVMETLLRDEISPSATSRILANNILNSLEGQPPTYASRSFLEANCRAFRRIMWTVIVEDKQGLGQESVFEMTISLTLETVLGSTSLSINALSAGNNRCFAFCAGSTIVLTDIITHTQRYFYANALPAQSTPSYYNPATPTKAARNHAFASTPGKDDLIPSIASLDNSADYPGKTKPSHRPRTLTSVALSPSAKYLAVGEVGHHPRILVFSTAPSASPDIPVACLTEHTFGVQAIAFSSDSRWLCSLGDLHDGGLFLWSMNQKTGALKLDSSNRCTTADTVAWMGTNVITVGTRHVKVWRFEQPSSPTKCRRGLESVNDSSHASPVPKTLAGRNVLLGALKDAVFTCAVAIAEDAAVLCTHDGAVCLLDDANRSQRLCQVTKKEYSIACVTLDPSSRVVWLGGKGAEPEPLPLTSIFAARDPSLAAEKVKSPPLLGECKEREGLNICAICYTDDKLVTINTSREDVKLRDGSLLALDGHVEQAIRGHDGEIHDLTVHVLDGDQSLAASSGRDRTIQIFRVSKADCSLEQSLINEHAGPIRQVEFTQGGNVLVSISSDRTLVIHQKVTRTDDSIAFVSTKTIHLKASPTSMALLPDASSSLLLSAMDRCIRRISLTDGNTTHTFKTADLSKGESVTLSRLTVGILCGQSSRANVLAGFSSSDGSIRLYDTDTGSLLALMHGQTAVSDLALVQIHEPGGNMKTRLVSTGGSDGTIMLWSVTMPPQDEPQHSGGDGTGDLDPSKPKPPSSMRLARRVLSKAEIASFQRSLKEQSDNRPNLSRNLSPSRLRRKPSRYAISDRSEAPGNASSENHSPELAGRDIPRDNRLKHASPPLCPKVNLQPRTRRSSLDERHRHPATKQAVNIDVAAKQICNTLQEFRKLMANGQESLSTSSAQALQRQLQATMNVVAPLDQRSDRVREDMSSEVFDEYLAAMIDKRLALQSKKEDQTVTTSGSQDPLGS
ncbi:MAG: hypothetical protein Q9168_002791 [Polycauliona sp. 1 TL-2023]